MHSVAFLMNGAKAPRGGELLTLSLIRNLRRDLFNPVVICAEESTGVAQLREEGIRVLNIALDHRLTSVYPREVGLRNSWMIVDVLYHFAKSGCLSVVTRALKECNADLLYCADNLSKLIGGIVVRRIGIKTVGHCHDELHRNLLGYTLKALNLLLLDQVIAVSDAVRKTFPSSRMGASKVVTIYNGVDTRRFDPEKVSPSGLEDLQFSEDTIVLAMIGTLDKNRGHSCLLRAFRKLKSEDVWNLKVVIAGQGPEEQALKSYSKEAGIAKDVHFLGFRLDIPEILKKASILVMPTLSYESFGMAAAEAMAMGVPVIGAQVGAIPDLVVHGQTGLLVPPGDEEALCNALRYLIDRPDLRRLMGQNGRARILEMFSLDRSIEQIERVFLTLLAEKGLKASRLMAKAERA